MSTTRARAKRQLISLSAIVLFIVAACGPTATATTVPVAATANTSAIVATALPQVESPTVQPAETIPINVPAPIASGDLEASIIGVYRRANPAVVYIV